MLANSKNNVIDIDNDSVEYEMDLFETRESKNILERQNSHEENKN